MLGIILFAAAVVPSGGTFLCTPTAVWDGDGPIWCAEGPKVRLVDIAARETDGSCNPNQPCPLAGAEDARDALVDLLGGAKGRRLDGHIMVQGPVLLCTSDGAAGGARTAARCFSSSVGDLSCAMLKTGTVLRWASYDRADRCLVSDETSEGSGIAFVRPEPAYSPRSHQGQRRTMIRTPIYFRNCAAAWAAGAAPMRVGQPGYDLRLDGDRDGVACEPFRR